MKRLIVLFSVLLLMLSACGEDGTGQGTKDSDSNITVTGAEKVFQNNCAYCHGSDLTGGAGPDLTEVGSVYSEEEIVEIIREGKGAMPRGLVEGENLELISSWLAQKK